MEYQPSELVIEIYNRWYDWGMEKYILNKIRYCPQMNKFELSK